jgi:hypothetical protein
MFAARSHRLPRMRYGRLETAPGTATNPPGLIDIVPAGL